jgi:eukaryotic-like serine/threonine-protein kinase
MNSELTTADHQGAPPISDVLHPGDKAGPWVVEYELGRGGMGAVYAVVHEQIGKRAALKVVHQRLLVPGFNPDRMLLEARVVNQIGHPNIVDIFETGRLPDTRPYIVMERLAGQPLSSRADEAKIRPEQVIALLLQICDALVAAHAAGIVHRDLKLDNVFLCNDPDDPSTLRVKVLDWGIAKVINHDVHHTVEGLLVGTPQYLAPEQACGATVSAPADVYSLGVMAYRLFLEKLPFEAETSAELMVMHLRATPPPASNLWPDIPAALEQLLDQMLAKSPDHRPTMLDVARRLEIVRAELRKRPTAAPIDSVDATEPKMRPSITGLTRGMPFRRWIPSRRWAGGSVRALSLAETRCAANASPLWHDGAPFSFLNKRKMLEHARFDGLPLLPHGPAPARRSQPRHSRCRAPRTSVRPAR